MPGSPFVICYICGREYGSASIGIHEPKCLEKWNVQNNQLPKNQRRPPPVKPGVFKESAGTSGPAKFSENKDMYNEQASRAANGNLVPCSKCDRTFLADRISVHEKVCRGVKVKPNHANNNKSDRPSTATLSSPVILKNQLIADVMEMNVSKGKVKPGKATERIFRSPTVVCYICSREFGSKSISIHEPQCMIKWNIENNKLPKSQRRTPPIKPTEMPIKSSNGYNNHAYNELAWKTSLENRVSCDSCGRKFNPDRLEVHKRSCKPKF